MQTHSIPIPFTAFDIISSAIGGFVFILLISFVKEPVRQKSMTIMLALAGGVYVNNGFGQYEMLFALVIAYFAYKGLKSYRFIAVGWFIHTAIDLLHHTNGYSLISSDPLSALGCAVFDIIIGIWFLFNAPNIYSLFQNKYLSVKNGRTSN